MTPTQKEWQELQRQVYKLQETSATPEELRQLAEVLTLIDAHLYSPELNIISNDTQQGIETAGRIVGGI
uniref:Uncharacterized protein n=1 Tax=viral metagenome TaxID=1070528 RepID=A0A6H2A509_9ZZZZ